MAVQTSYYLDLIWGLAELLAEDDVGFQWRDRDAQHPLFPMKLPSDIDHGTAISPYPLTADPSRAQSETGVQFYSRSAGNDVSDVLALDALICSRLLGRFPIHLPTGLRITSLPWTSGSSMGQDNADRWLWVSNFTANHYLPTPYRH